MLIPHHAKLPKTRRKGGRRCPLPNGFPCVCEKQKVSGMHTVHFEHIISKIWAPHFRPGDALILDCLNHHFSIEILQELHRLHVTPLFMPPGACFATVLLFDPLNAPISLFWPRLRA